MSLGSDIVRRQNCLCLRKVHLRVGLDWWWPLVNGLMALLQVIDCLVGA